MNAIHEASVFQARIFRLNLLDHLLAERTNFRRASDDHAFVALEATKSLVFNYVQSRKLFHQHLLTTDTIKCSSIVLQVGIEIGPELHQEEGILRALFVQLFKPAALLGKLVVDFLHVHGLQEWMGWLFCYMYKEMLVVLKWQKVLT